MVFKETISVIRLKDLLFIIPYRQKVKVYFSRDVDGVPFTGIVFDGKLTVNVIVGVLNKYKLYSVDSLCLSQISNDVILIQLGSLH